MKLQTEIVVEPKEGLCTWKIDASRLAYDATVIVGPGCQVLYYVNGALSNLLDPGRYCINPKKERRENNSIALVGVNRGKNFSLVWGVGGIPYRDKESRAEAEIGMNGEYVIQILQPAKLYAAFGKADIAPAEIASKMRAKLAETLKTQLSKQLGSYSYLNIQSAQSEIAETARNAFREELFALGIDLKSFALKEIYFPDEFKKARLDKKNREDEFDEMIRRQDEEKERRIGRLREADAMGEFISKVNASAPSGGGASQVKCPVCGTLCESGAVFCPKCGKKL